MRTIRGLIGATLILLVVGKADAATYTLTEITLGGTTTKAFAVNASGQVAGYGSPVGIAQDHAFLFANGTAKDLGTLGGQDSGAYAINDAGIIVGQSSLSGNAVTRAFAAFGGVIADIGTLGGSNGFARGINASGVIVGYSDTTGNVTVHAFRRTNGVMTDLGSLAGAGEQSEAFGVNDLGEVVGWTKVAGGKQHGFLFTTGAMADLDTLGGDVAQANAINNSTHIVGYSLLANNSTAHAFLNIDGIVSDLGTLGGTTSEALDINDADQIVGYAHTAGNVAHAFLYQNGVMVDLNDLVTGVTGWVLSYAYSINESGQIAGYGTHNGQTSAFLLTPVKPVPAVAAPTLAIAGKKKFTTARARVTIKGTATGSVTRVSYRVGKKGAFRTAAGTNVWRFRAKLQPGRNRIRIQAEGPGGASPLKTVTVTRN